MNIPKRDWTDKQFLDFFGIQHDICISNFYSELIHYDYNNGDYALLLTRSNYVIVRLFRYQNERLRSHNDNFPARIEIDEYNNCQISFHKNGVVHRGGNKPAIFFYNKDGLLIKELYFINNELHNIAGPAFRDFSNGKWSNRFYIRDKRVYLNHFCDFINKQ